VAVNRNKNFTSSSTICLHTRLLRYRRFLEHPRVQLHFTSTYSSWLNQMEIWFAQIEREVIARGVFTSVRDLAREIMRYIRAYPKTARPFK